jgi:hypothetical protein
LCLGFLTNVARRLAEKLGKDDTAALLRNQESALERSRLMKEETKRYVTILYVKRKDAGLNQIEPMRPSIGIC